MIEKYKNDIIQWLEKCRKEAVTHSILRETITQYINLIKYLTHQTINENMEKEIVKLSNFYSFFLKEPKIIQISI